MLDSDLATSAHARALRQVTPPAAPPVRHFVFVPARSSTPVSDGVACCVIYPSNGIMQLFARAVREALSALKNAPLLPNCKGLCMRRLTKERADTAITPAARNYIAKHLQGGLPAIDIATLLGPLLGQVGPAAPPLTPPSAPPIAPPTIVGLLPSIPPQTPPVAVRCR